MRPAAPRSWARTSACSRSFSRARPAAATAPEISVASSASEGSCTSAAIRRPSRSTRVTARASSRAGIGNGRPSPSRYSWVSGRQYATCNDGSLSAVRSNASSGSPSRPSPRSTTSCPTAARSNRCRSRPSRNDAGTAANVNAPTHPTDCRTDAGCAARLTACTARQTAPVARTGANTRRCGAVAARQRRARTSSVPPMTNDPTPACCTTRIAAATSGWSLTRSTLRGQSAQPGRSADDVKSSRSACTTVTSTYSRTTSRRGHVPSRRPPGKMCRAWKNVPSHHGAVRRPRLNTSGLSDAISAEVNHISPVPYSSRPKRLCGRRTDATTPAPANDHPMSSASAGASASISPRGVGEPVDERASAPRPAATATVSARRPRRLSIEPVKRCQGPVG